MREIEREYEGKLEEWRRIELGYVRWGEELGVKNRSLEKWEGELNGWSRRLIEWEGEIDRKIKQGEEDQAREFKVS